MTPNIIQTNTNYSVTGIPGGDFGPGTRAMINVTASLTGVTSGNALIVIVTGSVAGAGNQMALGPPVGATSTPGGSLPATIYYVGASYSDSSGRETGVGAETVISVAANNLLVVNAPNNPNFSGANVPGAAGWNVYVGTAPGVKTKQNTSLLAINVNWTEPSSGLIAGSAPPVSPVRDSAGTAYSKALWVDGNFSGTLQGQEAIGVFYASNVVAGTHNFFIPVFAFDSNPIFGVNAVLDIIVAEISNMPTPINLQDITYIQQNVGTASPLTLNSNTFTVGVVTTSFGTSNSNVAAEADLYTGGADFLFAIFSGYHLGTPPLTPTLSTGDVYIPVGNVTASDAMALYVWSTIPTGLRAAICSIIT